MGRIYTGYLISYPAVGRGMVIFRDPHGHRKITTPVKRFLGEPGGKLLYVETENSVYKLEIHGEPMQALRAAAQGPVVASPNTSSAHLWDFAMALGYASLAMLVVQFVLTARVRRLTAPFGIDLVYYFHRYLAVLGLLVVLVHYAILKLANPAALGPLDWRAASPHMTAGRMALLLFLAAVLLSLLRRQLRLEYDRWRLAHALLTTAGVALAMAHMLGSGHYLDDPWKQSLWACYGIAWAGLIAYVRVLRPWQLVRRPWRADLHRLGRQSTPRAFERSHRGGHVAQARRVG